MSKKDRSIRDLVYLDFDKAASIWSQFQEGLPDRVSLTAETGKTKKAGTKFSVPTIADANMDVDYLEKRSTLESKTLHHDILNRVEKHLADSGLVTDLTKALDAEESSASQIRGALCGRPYLRVAGASVIEDYRKILKITEKFNDLAAFTARPGLEKLKQSAEYTELEALIAETRIGIGKTVNRKTKADEKARAEALERKLEEMGNPKAAVDQWILDGLRLWIETFMSERINFRIYPFVNSPSFQVLCNLKRDCFVDSDLEHLLYGYGNVPNVPLAVFGLITSLPSETSASFDPMAEFETLAEVPEPVAFEKAFREIFGAMDGLENFVRYSRYPNVTIHPIAVYRSFLADTNQAESDGLRRA